jgi:signal transduction histidine kinase
MRREVIRVAVTATCLALVLLMVPLGFALFRLLQSDENIELERAALLAAVQVDPAFTASDPVELPTPEPGTQLGLYDATGVLRTGSGPTTADSAVRRALKGAVGDQSEGDQFVVAVPVSGSERVTGAIRAATPRRTVWQRTVTAWAALLALAVGALLAAVGVARARARRLAAPLERLASASRSVGDGDFTVRVAACGIAEVDHVAATQNATAQRLAEMLERERQFAANASHQLRTPLAGLQLGLEAAMLDPTQNPGAALGEALRTTRHLQATVENVLSLHRISAEPPPGIEHQAADGAVPDGLRPLAAQDFCDDISHRWHGSFAAVGRQLTVDLEPQLNTHPVQVDQVGQILDVLLDNCLKHGAGQITIRVRTAGTALAIDVSDEGTGVPPEIGDIFRRGAGSGNGIGLNLARRFATSLGGRLILSSRTPPVFTLFLPAPPT